MMLILCGPVRFCTFSEALITLQSELDGLRKKSEEQKTLIASLEHDLLCVQALQRSPADGAPADDLVSSESPNELIAKAVGDVVAAPLVRHSSETFASTEDSLLPIVASQRERFRKRVQELEEEGIQQQQHNALMQSEIEKLRGDNVKLYEKIRFLQSYQSGRMTNQSLNFDDAEGRYSGEYENFIDPFRRFNQQEKQRKYQSLRTHDKATLGFSRILMGSSHARAIVFFYLLFLHCLVFMVLYKIAHTESCKRDMAAECHAKFQQHMQNVHGINDFHG